MSPEHPTIKAVRTPATPGISMHQFPVDRAEREMGEICAAPPSRFQRADFKACLIVFRPFREKLLRKQLGIHSRGYGEHEAE